jgi:hypothetical protein
MDIKLLARSGMIDAVLAYVMQFYDFALLFWY